MTREYAVRVTTTTGSVFLYHPPGRATRSAARAYRAELRREFGLLVVTRKGAPREKRRERFDLVCREVGDWVRA